MFFGFELGFGFFTGLGDEEVTGFLADHGDGGFAGGLINDAFEAGGF